MKILEIALTSNPSAHLTAYLTDNCSELEMKRWTRRPAMLVIPGGAYHFLAEREGEPIAQKFSAMGYQTFVLGYTLHPSSREPYEDAVAAMRTIRENAEQWHVASRQICVSGFSAGGNLALWAPPRPTVSTLTRDPTPSSWAIPARTAKAAPSVPSALWRTASRRTRGRAFLPPFSGQRRRTSWWTLGAP